VGLPDDLTGFESDVRDRDGDPLSVAGLAQDEIIAGEGAADELDIEPGDTVVLTLRRPGEEARAYDFTVREIAQDGILTGSLLGEAFGFVLPLKRLQAMTGRENMVDFIAISNDGGIRDGVDATDEVTKRLNEHLEGTPWAAEPVKKDLVETASELASFLTTFFVVLGLFSIAAGMLLIFLIFVMLAAERKTEMGMVRAVGTKRSHLVQIFMSEGMVYNVVSAAIGCGLGVGVSVVLVGIMARLFADFGLQITFHVTPRSLIVAYSIGVVLTFLTVTFSSWRIGALNIVSAIRDLPDPVTDSERPSRGGGNGVMHAVRVVAWVLFKPGSWGQFFRGLGAVIGGVVGIVIGVVLFMLAVAVYDAGAAGGVFGVLLGVLSGLIIAIGAVVTLVGLSQIFQWGPLMLLSGPLLMVSGLSNPDASMAAFSFGAGLTLVIIGAALLLRFLGAPARLVFTSMGVLILFFWLLFAGGNTPIERINELNGDIEMFFLSGVTMVLAGTFVLVYNADLLLYGLTLTGGVLSSAVPAIKTAVAYPLANKFRTGMTIAMISLVMFALVMMSTMNENFDRLFLSDDALAGYDVVVSENPGNQIDDLAQALRESGPVPGDADAQDGGASGDEVAARIVEDDLLLVANRQVSNFKQLDGVEDPESNGYQILGMSPDFIEHNALTFQQRARGFGSDEEILRALAENPDYVVIDAFALSQDFGPPGPLEGIEATDRTFEPMRLEMINSATGLTREVTLIGIISTPASGLFNGLFVSQEAFGEVFLNPEQRLHYLKLAPGSDSRQTEQDIERTLLAQGAQADSLRKIVDDYTAQSRGFLYLMQAFMGIGLFVGIAAVGVIAFRTVVERRQQIGMLRAIGYTRRAIAASFLMESSFTSLLGIFSGIALGLLLANQLVRTDEFVSGGVPSFYIPWGQILLIAAFAFVSSLVMTIIPSRQASGIPIAEALRYE
jgi:putative ABC transport system permease protein